MKGKETHFNDARALIAYSSTYTSPHEFAWHIRGIYSSSPSTTLRVTAKSLSTLGVRELRLFHSHHAQAELNFGDRIEIDIGVLGPRFTVTVNIVLLDIRMHVKYNNLKARHREQINKCCQEKDLHFGQRPAHCSAQYEPEIWCMGASTSVGCVYLCVTTRDSRVSSSMLIWSLSRCRCQQRVMMTVWSRHLLHVNAHGGV